jgi:hypothetical protein
MLNYFSKVLVLIVFALLSVSLSFAASRPASSLRVTTNYSCKRIKGLKIAYVKMSNGKVSTATSVLSQLKKLLRDKKLSRKNRTYYSQSQRSIEKYIKNKCFNPTSRKPSVTAQSFNVTVIEGRSSSFQLIGKSSDSAAITYEVLNTPPNGIISGTAPELTYLAPHITGEEKLTYRVINSSGASEPATVTFNVTQSPDELAGVFNSLTEYRSGPLSAQEVIRVCRKAAFGCDDRLISIGVNQGLDALVNELLNYEVSDEVKQYASNIPYHSYHTTQWHQQGAERYIMAHALYGDGLREKLYLIFQTKFFSSNHTSVGPDKLHSGNFTREWVLSLHEYAYDFHQLLSFMNRSLAMNVELGNHTNRVERDPIYNQVVNIELNENYARELMELFSMGRINFLTGNLNYTQEDIRQLTRALTGFDLVRRQDNSEILGFFEERRDIGDKILFGSNPTDFDYEDAINLLLARKETAENLSKVLLSSFISPEVSPEVIRSIANLLIKNNYNLKPVLSVILKSSMMFSPEAHQGCITSPWEHIVLTIKGLKHSIGTGEFLEDLVNWSEAAGENPLANPSIFGSKGCGVGNRLSRNEEIARGEVFTSGPRMLENQRGMAKYLNRLFTAGRSLELLKIMPNSNSSAKETLDNILLRLDLTLTENQKQILIDKIMSSKKSTGNINYVSSPWSSTDSMEKRVRVAQLIQILISFYPEGRIQ